MLNILTVIFLVIMSILSFLGKWKVNRFGLGMLWLLLALSVYYLNQAVKLLEFYSNL